MVRRGNSFPFGFRSTETTRDRGHLLFPPIFSRKAPENKKNGTRSQHESLDTRNCTERNVLRHGTAEEREPQQDLPNEAARFESEHSPLSIAGQGLQSLSPQAFDEEKRESEQVAKKAENASLVLKEAIRANTKSTPPSNFRYASSEKDDSIEIEAKTLVADRILKHKQPAEASKNVTKYYFEITPSQLDGVTVTRKHARDNNINVFAYVRIAGQGSESCNPPVECSSATLLEDERGKMIRKQMGIFWSPPQDHTTKRGTLSVQVDPRSLERIALEIGIHSDDHYQKFVSMLLDIKAIRQQTSHVKLKFQLPGTERRTSLFSRRKSHKVHIGSVQCNLMNDLVLHATCRIRVEIDLSASSMTNNPFDPREHISDSVSPQPIDIKGAIEKYLLKQSESELNIDSIVSKPSGKELLQANTERNSVENEVGIGVDHHYHDHTQGFEQSVAPEVPSLDTLAIAKDIVLEDGNDIPNIKPPGTSTTSKIQLSEPDRTNISEDGKEGKSSCLSDVNPNSVDSQCVDHHYHDHTQGFEQSVAPEVPSLDTLAIVKDIVLEDGNDIPNIKPPGTSTTSKIQLSEPDRTYISEDGKDQGKSSCLSDVHPNSVDSQYPLSLYCKAKVSQKKTDADKSDLIKEPRKFRKFVLSNFTFDDATTWMQREYSKLKESVPTSISSIPIIGDSEKRALINGPRRKRKVELANFSFDDVTEVNSSSIPIFDKDSVDSISVDYNQLKRSTNKMKESESSQNRKNVAKASVKTKHTIQPERSAKRENRNRRVQDLVDTTSDSFSVHSETSQRAKHDIDYICGCIPNDFQDIFTNVSYDAESVSVHSDHDSETIEVPTEKEVPEEVISDLLENLLNSMDGDSVTTKDLNFTAKKLNMAPGDLFQIIEAAEKKAQEN
jgi:hypothetical protein